MHRRHWLRALAAGATLTLYACTPPPPALPPEDRLAQGMADVLIDTGFYAEVGITGRLGNHYNPSEDIWKIIACFRFITVDGAEGTNCVDSFSAFRLDNGNWVVTVTINELYRWRTIVTRTDRPGAPEPAAPPAPPTE